MLDNVHVYGVMLLFRAVLTMLVSQREPMRFRCLMFSSSGPCELLFCFVLLSIGPELW